MHGWLRRLRLHKWRDKIPLAVAVISVATAVASIVGALSDVLAAVVIAVLVALVILYALPSR